MGKESNFLPLKYKSVGKESNFLPPPPPCTASSPHKSFPTQVPLEMQSYPSWQILPHMGKKSSFLPQNANKAILPHMEKSQAFFPQNAKLSFLTNPSHIICREGFFLVMHNLCKSFPTNLYFFFYFFFIFHFIFISIFTSDYFFFLIFFIFLLNFLYFYAKLEILPQSGKIIPQHLRWIIEE